MRDSLDTLRDKVISFRALSLINSLKDELGPLSAVLGNFGVYGFIRGLEVDHMTGKRVALLASKRLKGASTKAQRSVAASALSDRTKPKRKWCRTTPRKKKGRRSGRR